MVPQVELLDGDSSKFQSLSTLVTQPDSYVKTQNNRRPIQSCLMITDNNLHCIKTIRTWKSHSGKFKPRQTVCHYLTGPQMFSQDLTHTHAHKQDSEHTHTQDTVRTIAATHCISSLTDRMLMNKIVSLTNCV